MNHGINIAGHIASIGPIKSKTLSSHSHYDAELEALDTAPFNIFETYRAPLLAEVEDAKKNGDSVGATIEMELQILINFIPSET